MTALVGLAKDSNVITILVLITNPSVTMISKVASSMRGPVVTLALFRTGFTKTRG